MKGIRIILYVLGGLAIFLVAAIIIFFLAEDTITSLKNPEWPKFRNEMMDAYPDIDRVIYTDVGATFSIQFDMESSLSWSRTEETFSSGLYTMGTKYGNMMVVHTWSKPNTIANLI